MGRAKRLRKMKATRRRARRLEQLEKTLCTSRRFLKEQSARAVVRRRIEASDIPKEMKVMLGLLVDPIGALTELTVDGVAKARKEDA
jgi:hypothetical protein